MSFLWARARAHKYASSIADHHYHYHFAIAGTDATSQTFDTFGVLNVSSNNVLRNEATKGAASISKTSPFSVRMSSELNVAVPK